MMAAQALSPHWTFAELMAGICELPGPAVDLDVQGLCLDSRQVRQGDVYFACAGTRVHGEAFIDQAISRGAQVVLRESARMEHAMRDGVMVYGVPGLRDLVGVIAERFYGSPSQEQFVVGVTGTNGKTSISQFIARGFQEEGPCGVIGTLGNGLFGDLVPATHTTPDAISLHATLDELRRAGARHVVMEVSSHGLEQGRVSGVSFDVAVFSNLSHEHLDYHGDMRSYGLAKQRLFESAGLKYAVINSDDEFGRQLLKTLPTGVSAVSYGLNAKRNPMLLASDLQLDRAGLCMQISGAWGHGELCAPLLGAFNAANLLAALAVLLVSEIDLQDALQRLSRVRPVAGRMESFGGGEGQPLVVVDYAHTPDALHQVLAAVRAHTDGKVHCVFGCGGDRDKAKRPLMAALAEQYADRVVVTDDNPRSERSADIIADIRQGFTSTAAVEIIADRAVAIANAISSAAPADLVLIAGKGHEDYQLVGDQRLPFSDVLAVKRALAVYGGRG